MLMLFVSAKDKLTMKCCLILNPRPSKYSLPLYPKIKELFQLPVDYQDERLTTVQAERMLVEQADVSRNKRKKVIDKLAAQLILQNYLDRTI